MRSKHKPRRRCENRIPDDASPPGVEQNNTPEYANPRPPPDPAGLLSKRRVLELVGVSWPTIWHWMEKKKFPPAREIEGRPYWLVSEYEAWLATLPLQKYKWHAGEASE